MTGQGPRAVAHMATTLDNRPRFSYKTLANLAHVRDAILGYS